MMYGVEYGNLLKFKHGGTKALLAFQTNKGITHRAKTFESLYSKYLTDSSKEYSSNFSCALPKEFMF